VREFRIPIVVFAVDLITQFLLQMTTCPALTNARSFAILWNLLSSIRSIFIFLTVCGFYEKVVSSGLDC
jgi:uncharacterized membrane protein